MKAIEVKNEPYEPKRMEAIYQNLLANHNAGVPQDYEIILDGFSVVSRNNNPDRFMTYSDFINSDSKCVTVLLYRRNLNSSDKYYFTLKANTGAQQDQLQ